MNPRIALAVFLNILAVALPGLVLFAVFGGETRVSADSASQLGALLLSGLVAFSIGLVSAALLRKEGRVQILDFAVTCLTRDEGEPDTKTSKASG
jgi:hypothetical protein